MYYSRGATQKLRPEVVEAINHAVVHMWSGPLREGADPEHVLKRIVAYTVGLLQLPKETLQDFYED